MFDEEPDGDPHGECANEIHKLQAENEKLRAALEWYASDGDGERFQIIDGKGEVIANFATFTSRAKAALGR